MSTYQNSPKALPPRPSDEHLRKQAKRLARRDGIQLATAQWQLAHEYGYRNWSELMLGVRAASSEARSGSGSGSSENSGSTPPRAESGNLFPLLPLRGLIAFPHVTYPVFVGRPKSIKAVLSAKERGTPIVLSAQSNSVLSSPTETDLYAVGTIATLVQFLELQDGTLRTVWEGQKRARISRFILDQERYGAETSAIEEPASSDPEIAKLIGSTIGAYISAQIKPVFSGDVSAERNPSALADRIASDLPIPFAQKQALLEIADPIQRLKRVRDYLLASA